MAAHVFISYVRDDSAIVDRLCADLRAAGVNVWLDRNALSPGIHWEIAIRRAIRRGAYFVACFSTIAVRRTDSFFYEEIRLAFEQLRQHASENTWFIPVLLNPCKISEVAIGNGGTTLQSIQQIDLYQDWQQGVNRIIDLIRPDVRTNRVAHIEALTDDRIARLIDSLDDIESSFANDASEKLSRLGFAAVPALAKALTRSDPVRWRAVCVLRDLGPTAALAVPAMVEAVRDHMAGNKKYYAFHFWQYALSALARIGHQDTWPLFVDVIQDLTYDDFRTYAEDAMVQAVERFRDVARPTLGALLSTTRGSPRLIAVHLLLATSMRIHGLDGALCQELNDGDVTDKRSAAEVVNRFGSDRLFVETPSIRNLLRALQTIVALRKDNDDDLFWLAYGGDADAKLRVTARSAITKLQKPGAMT